MASQYTADNMTAYTRAQIRHAAKSLGIYHDNAVSTTALLASVKAR